MTRLIFRGSSDYDNGGEWVLLDTGMLELIPAPEFRAKVGQFTDKVDDAALKWGASLVAVLAAIGAFLFTKGKRTAGWALFGLSGGTGLLARSARNSARQFETALFRPHPLKDIHIVWGERGELRFEVTGIVNGPRWTLKLAAGDYDAEEAARFLAAVEAARAAEAKA
jgi:hypothetical protein